MRLTDDYGNPYPFSLLPAPGPTDFARLQAAVADRAPNLRLHRTRLDTGQLVITVMVPGATPSDPWGIGSYIARGFNNTWQIHHPDQGPQMEFNTAQQVAKFLAVDPSFPEGWQDAWNQWMAARGELFASE
jgi:hypothetical protein